MTGVEDTIYGDEPQKNEPQQEQSFTPRSNARATIMLSSCPINGMRKPGMMGPSPSQPRPQIMGRQSEQQLNNLLKPTPKSVEKVPEVPQVNNSRSAVDLVNDMLKNMPTTGVAGPIASQPAVSSTINSSPAANNSPVHPAVNQDKPSVSAIQPSAANASPVQPAVNQDKPSLPTSPSPSSPVSSPSKPSLPPSNCIPPLQAKPALPPSKKPALPARPPPPKMAPRHPK